MSSQIGPSVLQARDRLAAGRAKLREHHRRGSPGIQLCAQLTDLLDGVILDLYQAALADAGGEIESEIALVPHGGYGRRDMAPFSDVDLMLLYHPEATARVAAFARSFTQSIYDSGLDLGFSARTPQLACSLAQKDATIFTSLVESRYLVGSVRLYSRFAKRFRRLAQRRGRALMSAIVAARREERQQYGESVYLLRPNVKRSRGSLRDLQLVRWIGFARYGEAGYDNLERAGILTSEDRQTLRHAREFLLRLRNELHFHAGRSQDVLNRQEQVRLADLWGYQGREGLLPVELFMKEYFENISQAHYAVAHFVASARSHPTLMRFVEPLFSHQMEGDFRVGPGHIGATRKGLEKLKGDLSQVLRLMDLANMYNKRISHDTWMYVRKAMLSQDSLELSDEAARRFLSLLSQPARLANLLRRLHEMRVLEKIIPAVQHARCLLQWNDYHKYTVDEHSIRAVEAATSFLNDPGPIGAAYRSIENKRTLHLALLIHDLGKGFSEDHSDVGLRLAEDTAMHLKLPPRETEVLKFLVHKHLIMAHLAFRHDLNDEATTVQLAVEVGSPDVLQMLLVLSCADLAAVGPGVLNDWKVELLTELYQQTWRNLTGESPPGMANVPTDRQRRELRELAPKEDSNWWQKQIDAIPSSFLVGQDPQQVIDQLSELRPGDASSPNSELPNTRSERMKMSCGRTFIR